MLPVISELSGGEDLKYKLLLRCKNCNQDTINLHLSNEIPEMHLSSVLTGTNLCQATPLNPYWY